MAAGMFLVHSQEFRGPNPLATVSHGCGRSVRKIKMLRRPVIAVVGLVLLLSSPAFATDDFYEQQLRAGKNDFLNNRVARAADELRIAAFGLLENPPLLQEALVRLALAQEMLGETSEFGRTLDRFIEVEQKFAPYRSLQLEPQIKSAFEKLLSTSVPRQTLASIPGLAPIANYELHKIAELPEEKRLPAYKAGAAREPNNAEWPLAVAREYAAKNNDREVVRWATKAMEVDPKNIEAAALLARTRAASRDCREAIVLLTEAVTKAHPELFADEAVCLVQVGRFKEAQAAMANVPPSLRQRADVTKAAQAISKALPSSAAATAPAAPPTAPAASPTIQPASVASTSPAEVLDISHRLIHDGKFADAESRLRAAVDANPASRPLRLALLEAAVLAKDWQTAASQLPSIMPLETGEELYMFYSSVALYETGQKEQARPLMERARARMVPSPLVNYYLKTILGENG